MAVRTRALGWVNNATVDVWEPLFTVPAGRTAIVRSLMIVNASGTVRRVRARVRSASSAPLIFEEAGLGSPATLQLVSLDLAVNPGDVLEVLFMGGGQANGMVAYASGSLLLGEPE